jgi:hypothetical protein
MGQQLGKLNYLAFGLVDGENIKVGGTRSRGVELCDILGAIALSRIMRWLRPPQASRSISERESPL